MRSRRGKIKRAIHDKRRSQAKSTNTEPRKNDKMRKAATAAARTPIFLFQCAHTSPSSVVARCRRAFVLVAVIWLLGGGFVVKGTAARPRSVACKSVTCT